jgi:hypothetical protein
MRFCRLCCWYTFVANRRVVQTERSDSSAFHDNILTSIQTILGEVANPSFLDPATHHEPAGPLVRELPIAWQAAILVVEFLGESTNIFVIQTVALQANASAVHAAEVSHWLGNDHIRPAPRGCERCRHHASPAPIDTNIRFKMAFGFQLKKTDEDYRKGVHYYS